MIIPLMSGIYIVAAICGLSIFVLCRLDSSSDYPDHPLYHIKGFFMLLVTVTFLYLLAWLAGAYGGFIISSLL